MPAAKQSSSAATRTGAPSTGSTFRDRLGIYLMGVAIGFALLGMLWMAKNTATRGTPTAPAATPQAPTINNPALAPGATATPK